MFESLVHLPLHLSAIRCNYLSQQGQLQRHKSIPQCRRLGWDHFQHDIISPAVIHPHLIRSACTLSCFTVWFTYSGCHHVASDACYVGGVCFTLKPVLIHLFIRLNTTNELPVDVCARNGLFHKNPSQFNATQRWKKTKQTNSVELLL